MHVHAAGPGRTCTLLLASLSGADNQNKQDAGYRALCIDPCGINNASRMHFLTAWRPFRVRFRQKIQRRDPKSVCPVSRRAVRVEILTTRRAGKWHVVTASKCGIYCFNSYLFPLSCAVIFCGCMETDEEGFFAGHSSMQLMPLL